MGTEDAARITHADLDRLDLFRRAYDDAIARRANASNPWSEYQWAVTEAAPALIACCRISAGIPLPVLAWITANPEAAKGLASGEMVAVPRGHLEGLQRHYRENLPRGSRESVDVRDLVAALDLPYVPAVINYDASGESEFVLFDTLTIAHDGPGYIILKDETGAVIGFRWRTASPPAPSVTAQGETT